MAAPPAERNSGLYRQSNARSEAYGFALYIVSSVLWVLWVVWALCPDSVLVSLGIGWYPRREWAYLLVAWSLVLVLFTYIGFGALNMWHTRPLDSLDCITGRSDDLPDEAAIIYPALDDATPPLDSVSLADTGKHPSPFSHDIYDLSPGFVSRALYMGE